MPKLKTNKGAKKRFKVTATGKVLWRKDDFKGTLPRFFTSCSPIIVSAVAVRWKCTTGEV